MVLRDFCAVLRDCNLRQKYLEICDLVHNLWCIETNAALRFLLIVSQLLSHHSHDVADEIAAFEVIKDVVAAEDR